PARVDVVDRLAGGYQMLGQPAPVVAGPFDAPPALHTGAGGLGRGPGRQPRPPLRAVRPTPTVQFASRLIEGDGGMHALVRVHSNRDHGASFLVPDSCASARSSAAPRWTG